MQIILRPQLVKLNIKSQCATAFFIHFIVLEIPRMYFPFAVAKEACCCLLFTTDSWPCATHPEEILTAGKVLNYNLVSLQQCVGVWKQNWCGCRISEKEFDNKWSTVCWDLEKWFHIIWYFHSDKGSAV